MSEVRTPIDFDVPHLAIGTVIETIAGARWYNVRLGGEVAIPCAAVSSFGDSNPSGPSPIGVYAPGTLVIVYLPAETTPSHDGSRQRMFMPPGYILGSIPTQTGNTDRRVMDWIAPFSGADSANDKVHSHMMLNYSEQISDYNSGVPFDAMTGSDAGLINELGVGSGLSRFFAWMRASDTAGLWCFYLDNLTRLAAYNYEFWHAGGERWIKNDEGEVSDVDMMTPYPWEAMGMAACRKEAAVKQTSGGMWKLGQKQLWYEPKFTDQSMIPRHIKFKGYLGDLDREMIVTPRRVGYTDDYTERAGNRVGYTGLLDIHKHSDGMFTMRSARGIIHEKYIYIPVPKQVAVPEQKDGIGDGITNYNPSGVWSPNGTGVMADHDKQPYAYVSPAKPSTWAAEFLDSQAYLNNWFGLKTVHAHKLDWYLPEEGTFGEAEDSKGAFIPDAKLGQSSDTDPSETFYFKLPNFATLKVDHRKGDTKYYYSRSVMAQLPDGSILIEDGYGSSIHMTSGNIFMSGAGDIWLKPGRSVVTWAPDDIILRAGSSVDITTSVADVRIKAQRNLHMLSGNEGIGGILLESRGVYANAAEYRFGGLSYVGEDVVSYGIMIKSVDSPIMVYGGDVYLGAVDSAATGKKTNGNIVLDAAGSLVFNGVDDVITFTGGAVIDVLSVEFSTRAWETGPYAVNYYDAVTSVIGSEVFKIESDTIVMSGQRPYDTPPVVLCRGTMRVGKLYSENDTSDIKADGETATATFDAFFGTYLAPALTAVYNPVYAEDIRADAAWISYLGFSCRKAEQYSSTNSADFLLSEARWQQAYRFKGLVMTWAEPEVITLGGGIRPTQMPHPGLAVWKTDSRYRQYDTELWDWDKAKDKDRSGKTGSVYDYDKVRADHEGGPTVTNKKLSEAYLISAQKVI